MHHLSSEAKGAQALVVGLVGRAQVDQHQRLPVTRKGRLQEICKLRVPEGDLEEEEEDGEGNKRLDKAVREKGRT